eukprot:SAG31_NODE_3968_length_3708_cov_8.241618_2_plen_124_part_00
MTDSVAIPPCYPYVSVPWPSPQSTRCDPLVALVNAIGQPTAAVRALLVPQAPKPVQNSSLGVGTLEPDAPPLAAPETAPEVAAAFVPCGEEEGFDLWGDDAEHLDDPEYVDLFESADVSGILI